MCNNTYVYVSDLSHSKRARAISQIIKFPHWWWGLRFLVTIALCVIWSFKEISVCFCVSYNPCMNTDWIIYGGMSAWLEDSDKADDIWFLFLCAAWKRKNFLRSTNTRSRLSCLSIRGNLLNSYRAKMKLPRRSPP